MSSPQEIEAAIAKLPPPQIDQLARWLDDFRQTQGPPTSVDAWLRSARGAAIPGTTTEGVMELTRGGE